MGERTLRWDRRQLFQLVPPVEIVDAIRQLGRKIAPKYYRGLPYLPSLECLATHGEIAVSEPGVLFEDGLIILQLTGCPWPRQSSMRLRIRSGEVPVEIEVIIERPCGKRLCPWCEEEWRAYRTARIFSGANGVQARRLRFLTITAPPEVDCPSKWNATVFPRFGQVWRALRRRYPFLDAYAAVKEYHQRGLLHIHVLVRQSSAALLPKEDVRPGGAVAELLQRRGFGSHSWQAVTKARGGVKGVVGYMTKQLTETVQHVPPGTRVDTCSRNWPIGWKKYR